MPLSAVDVIGPAFERMKRQLFMPFRLGQWVRFAIVGFLAGEMGSGGGCSTRFPFNSPAQQSPPIPRMGFPFPSGPLILIAVCILVVLVFFLAIAFIYVSSRMRFVLFDSVLAGQCRIREFWSRRGNLAIRYFVWQILFSLFGVIALILLIGVPLAFAYGVGWFSSPSSHLLPLILGGIVLGLAFFAAIIVFAVVQVLVKDFVVPQMVFEDVTVGEGWRRLWTMIKLETGSFAGYVGMKIVLALAAAILLGIVALIVILVLLIPIGGVGAFTILGGRAAGLTWNPLTIAIAIVVGAIVLAVFLLVAALISVPAIVFFPSYSIYFFAERYPALRAVLYPPMNLDTGSTLPPL
jgi:hypothetical protein